MSRLPYASTKMDLITPKEQQELKSIYEPAGYRVLFSPARKSGEGIDEIKHIFRGKDDHGCRSLGSWQVIYHQLSAG